MQFNSSFRFRTKKTVGSPSAGGCGQITLASHVGDTNAHPQYMKRGEKIGEFNIGPHLLDAISHADNFARRAELTEGKRDYLHHRFMSLLNDPNNYRAELEVKRHIITAYVLRQVLEDFGLTEGVNLSGLMPTSKIVRTDGPTPVSDMESYVPSWSWVIKLTEEIQSINGELAAKLDDYLKIVDADKKFAKLDHNHDGIYADQSHTHTWADILNADSKGFATRDYVEQWLQEVYGNTEDTVEVELAEYRNKIGYVLTHDTTYVGDMNYYEFDPYAEGTSQWQTSDAQKFLKNISVGDIRQGVVIFEGNCGGSWITGTKTIVATAIDPNESAGNDEFVTVQFQCEDSWDGYNGLKLVNLKFTNTEVDGVKGVTWTQEWQGNIRARDKKGTFITTSAGAGSTQQTDGSGNLTYTVTLLNCTSPAIRIKFSKSTSTAEANTKRTAAGNPNPSAMGLWVRQTDVNNRIEKTQKALEGYEVTSLKKYTTMLYGTPTRQYFTFNPVTYTMDQVTGLNEGDSVVGMYVKCLAHNEGRVDIRAQFELTRMIAHKEYTYYNWDADKGTMVPIEVTDGVTVPSTPPTYMLSYDWQRFKDASLNETKARCETAVINANTAARTALHANDFVLTADTVYVEGTAYYTYNDETASFSEINTTTLIGKPIPSPNDEVWVSVASIAARMRELESKASIPYIPKIKDLTNTLVTSVNGKTIGIFEIPSFSDETEYVRVQDLPVGAKITENLYQYSSGRYTKTADTVVKRGNIYYRNQPALISGTLYLSCDLKATNKAFHRGVVKIVDMNEYRGIKRSLTVYPGTKVSDLTTTYPTITQVSVDGEGNLVEKIGGVDFINIAQDKNGNNVVVDGTTDEIKYYYYEGSHVDLSNREDPTPPDNEYATLLIVPAVHASGGANDVLAVTLSIPCRVGTRLKIEQFNTSDTRVIMSPNNSTTYWAATFLPTRTV